MIRYPSKGVPFGVGATLEMIIVNSTETKTPHKIPKASEAIEPATIPILAPQTET